MNKKMNDTNLKKILEGDLKIYEIINKNNDILKISKILEKEEIVFIKHNNKFYEIFKTLSADWNFNIYIGELDSLLDECGDLDLDKIYDCGLFNGSAKEVILSALEAKYV